MSISRALLYPFYRVVELTRPKKESKPDDNEANEDNKKEEKQEPGSSDGFPLEEVILDSNGLETNILGHDYRVRLTRPGHGVSVHLLQEALNRNRELLAESETEIYVNYVANIKQNEMHNLLVKAGDPKAVEEGKRPLDQWNENILRPGTQNALTARANIDLLIPLINMRGGVAQYIGQEALPINHHITGLRKKMEKQASEDNIPDIPPPNDNWTITEFLIAGVIALVIALLLKEFM